MQVGDLVAQRPDRRLEDIARAADRLAPAAGGRGQVLADGEQRLDDVVVQDVGELPARAVLLSPGRASSHSGPGALGGLEALDLGLALLRERDLDRVEVARDAVRSNTARASSRISPPP